MSHSFRRFRPLGIYEIHRLSDFILIPKLGFGGTIQNENPSHQFIQLDNGLLLSLAKATDYDYSKFLQTAKTFLTRAKSSLQTGLLEAHIPLFWNRSLSDRCFKEIPVGIWDTNTTKFLQFVNRRIQPHGTVLTCSARPNSTFLTDVNGQFWHLSANGTSQLFPLKQLFSHVKSLDFALIKLRGLNSHFVRPKHHQLDRSSLLDLVSANHVSLQEIYQISDTGHGSFLNGLGKLFGITINSLAKGGTEIITAVGHGLKQGFQVLGSFTHDAVTAAGNATGTVLESTGHAIKDTTTGMGSFFEHILGGVSGSIIWAVIFLVYLKFSDRCANYSIFSRQKAKASVSSPTNKSPPLYEQVELDILPSPSDSPADEIVALPSEPQSKQLVAHFLKSGESTTATITDVSQA